MSKACPYCGDCPPDGECGCIASEDVASLRARVAELEEALRDTLPTLAAYAKLSAPPEQRDPRFFPVWEHALTTLKHK